ncbi:nicotinate-nucleotide--dimethylbenzimidazole phosphoribosyltransferase [Thermodesulfovibrio aggregans]|uniref:Nicotinate-nucleotide--dimethylbenzimidazole phosphoribosyltransferase n=1 Tax=Thermodesulfovibrio aggregans TaxID=86166 RepID=A0A0U9HTB2_9BACT|nr:nicotinate-nucleotide--dimethylbenzimidazole phosphoribosyltransferase [Thermodesulfovibrio aggregans]GAQ95410.1 nicotinate-nucleotide--dimethylbenzimidazole phosphoribosyltransferase [Thermodesulfovibrio aggregans]
MLNLEIQPVKKEFFDIAWKRLNNLTKPQGSLGKLEEIAAKLVAIYENPMPEIKKKAVLVFASDHGVTQEGVSAYPKEVTAQMVFNFLRGGAGINVLARHAGAEVVVVDVGVDYDFEKVNGLISKKVVKGTGNIAKGPALTRGDAMKCIEIGIEVVKEYHSKGYNLFATGEMGIGNTTPSSAVVSVLTNSPVEEVTGRGTGIDEETFKRKVEVIKRAIEINKPDASDPVDVLSKVGGPEIGAISGVVLCCASLRIPVVVDGFISTAGALIAYCINPAVKDYIFASHNSVEKGHKRALDFMGLKPLLDLNLRLGEGTGAALAMTIIEAGLKIYREMATFDEAGVSKSDK